MSVEIFLDNYNNVCCPGQTLSGKVECLFNKEKNLRAIRVKFDGRAETRWSESERYYDHHSKKYKTRIVWYSGEEVYFNAEYNLIQGGEDFKLPPGRHTYPFSYILPQQIPSSFEGAYGNVRYSIKATVDRPWKFDYECKVQINVLSPLDLNYMPELKQPMATSTDKTLCCCCCKSGPLSFDISLPCGGYIPGQDINIGAYVQNLSNVSAESVIFKIVKNLEYISHYPSTKHRYEELPLSEIREGGIGAHGEKSWTSALTILSSDYFPNLIPCSIINITYRLKAKIVLPCPHSNLKTSMPLTIGTVPLSGINHGIVGPPLSMEMPLPNYDANLDYIQPTAVNGSIIESSPFLPNTSQPQPPNQYGIKSSYTDTSIKYAADGLPCTPEQTSSVIGFSHPSSGALDPTPRSTPYPPAGATPYPPAASAPYSSAEVTPYPPVNTMPNAPEKGSFFKNQDPSAPPSYDETTQSKEKQ